MPLNDLARSSVTKGSAGLTQVGFGTLMIADFHTKFAERFRRYSDNAGMAQDGFATTDPLYLMAQRAFQQEPRPVDVIVGRLALVYTQRIRWVPLITTPGYVQKLTIALGANTLTAEYTNGGSESVITIIAGMLISVQALDVFDADLAVTNNTTYMQIVTTAGKLAAYSNWTGTYEDFTTDPGIATDLDAIKLANNDWYGLALATASKAIQEAAAAWIEATPKMACWRTSDWRAPDSGETSDVGDNLMGLSYARSVTFYRKHATHDYADVGLLADRFPHDPGSPPGAGGTWHAKPVKGILADNLTDTEKANLRAKHYVCYVETASVSHTLDGKTASGEYADVTRFIDWTNVRIQEGIATIELSAERIPGTDSGISQIGTAVQKVLDRGVIAGGFSGDPYPVITLPKQIDRSTADKADRVLNDVLWSAELAGAIHLTNVSGTVSV